MEPSLVVIARESRPIMPTSLPIDPQSQLGIGDGDAGLRPGEKAMMAQLLLGEGTGRVRAPVGGLPSGVIAVTVPVRRDGEARAPRDRWGRLKVGDVDLISGRPTLAFDPPPDLATRELIFVVEAGRREWSTVAGFFGPERAWSVAISLVRCGGVVL